MTWPVALRAKPLNGFGIHPEDKEIFLPDFFQNLDIRPVEGSENQSSIEGKFHIPCPRSFGACCRDMLGKVRSGDQFFCHGDSIIFNENQLKPC